MKWLSALLLLYSALTAQTVTFNKALDYKNGLEGAISVIETDSGYVVMGLGYDFPLIGGWRGCVFMRTDINGEVISSSFYGKEAVHHYSTTGGFIKLANDGYIVGMTEGDSARGTYKALLIRYDEHGDTIFVRRFGGTGDDYGAKAIATQDTGFALFGTWDFETSYYLVKTDSSGEFEWQKTYAQSAATRGLSITPAYDGGYIMSGWKTNTGYGQDTHIVKTDSAGNVEWEKRYGTRNDDGGGRITAKSSDSTYIVCGAIDTFDLTTIDGQKLWSGYVMKIDLEGHIVWRYLTNSNWYQQIDMAREVYPNGGYIVTGSTYDSVYGATNAYGWLQRLDNDGNLLWERKYAYPMQIDNHGLSYSILADVQVTRDSGFICLGYTFDQEKDFWLLKLDSLGCMGDYCGLMDSNCFYKPYPNCDDTVGIENFEYIKIHLHIFPNPADDLVNFDLKSSLTSITRIRLFDAQGKLALDNNDKPNNYFSIAHLPSGIYYYEVSLANTSLPFNNSLYVRGKLLIVH